MSSDPYNAEVRARFASPSYAGVADNGLKARRTTPDADIELTARLDGDDIGELRFRAWGCPHVIAACDLACELLEGGPLKAIGEVDIREFLRRLSVPVEKTGRIIVREDVLGDLIEHGTRRD